MRLDSYPSYKQSEISWYEDIPEGWDVKPLFALANECSSSNKGMIEDNLLSLSYGKVINKNINSNDGLLPESFETYQVVESDDIVLRLTDLQNDKRSLRSAIVKERGIITSAYLAIRPTNIHPTFLNYLLRAYDLTKVFYSMGGGLRQSMKFSDVKRLPLILPSLEEQKSISMFLDSETAKIDSLVEAQEKLIELLKEKRQVVISEAVTKGLNSKVKVKDSGVAWLGKVPESWDVVRLKKITSRISSGKTPSGGAEVYVDIGVIFLRSQNVYDEGLRLEDVVRIPEKIDAEMSSSRVKGGDILLNITGGSIGRSCCLPYDFESANVNQHVCAIRLSDPDMVSFVELFFKSDIIKKQIDYIQNGAAREGLNFEQIGNFSICIPPPDERKLLVEEVKRKIKNFNDLISQIIESTSLLQERRSALISAAVCGQIDVRTTNGN